MCAFSARLLSSVPILFRRFASRCLKGCPPCSLLTALCFTDAQWWGEIMELARERREWRVLFVKTRVKGKWSRVQLITAFLLSILFKALAPPDPHLSDNTAISRTLSLRKTFPPSHPDFSFSLRRPCFGLCREARLKNWTSGVDWPYKLFPRFPKSHTMYSLFEQCYRTLSLWIWGCVWHTLRWV